MTDHHQVTPSTLSFVEKIQLLNEQASREKAERWCFDFHKGTPLPTNEESLQWRVRSKQASCPKGGIGKSSREIFNQEKREKQEPAASSASIYQTLFQAKPQDINSQNLKNACIKKSLAQITRKQESYLQQPASSSLLSAETLSSTPKKKKNRINSFFSNSLLLTRKKYSDKSCDFKKPQRQFSRDLQLPLVEEPSE